MPGCVPIKAFDLGQAAKDELGIRQRLHPLRRRFTVASRTNSPLAARWGELLFVAQADHLDVVGQFDGAGEATYSGWLSSGSPFDQEELERLWSAVAEDIYRTVQAPTSSRTSRPSIGQ